MDVSGISKNNGAIIFTWDCHNMGNQRWILSYSGEDAILTAEHSNLSATMKNGETTNGTELIQMPNQNETHQKFQIIPANGGFKIVNTKSGKCLDVQNSGKHNSAKIIQV